MKENTFRFNLMISPELNERIKVASKEQGITKSRFVRDAINSYLNDGTTYSSMEVELESRIKQLEDKVNKEEKETRGWIRRKLNL